MNSVKTYQKVNTTQQNRSFGISKMEDIYTKRKGRTDDPHRHNFYTILVINKGKGEHKIDFNSYKLAHKQIYFVSPGQVHQVIEKEKTEGYSMTFSNDFLITNSIPLSFIESLNLFHNYGQSPPLTPNQEQFTAIENFSKEMLSIFQSTIHMKDLAVGAYLKLLLIACNNICAVNPIEADNDSINDNLVRTFRTKVDLHYKEQHAANFYASQLNITCDH